MIVKCLECVKYYDDQFRNTDCQHDTFLANDGQNNFKHYSESWLADDEPSKLWQSQDKSEYVKYEEWLNKNKIRI